MKYARVDTILISEGRSISERILISDKCGEVDK